MLHFWRLNMWVSLPYPCQSLLFFPLTHVSNPSLLIQPSQRSAFMWNAAETFSPPRSPEDLSLSFPPKHSAQPITERNDERFRVRLTVPPTHFSTKSKKDGRCGGDVLSWRCKAQPHLLVSTDVLSWGWFAHLPRFPDDSWFWAQTIITSTVQWHTIMIYNTTAQLHLRVWTSQGFKKKAWRHKMILVHANAYELRIKHTCVQKWY